MDLIFQFRYVILTSPHCHFSFVKFYIEVSVYGKYCSLQRWRENHEALKFKRSCLRGKGTSYSIMLFLKKSTTKDTGYFSEMITAVYTDRRQKQIWHFNLNIQNGWSCGTCLPLLKLFLFFLWKLVTVWDAACCHCLCCSPDLYFWHLDTVGSLRWCCSSWGGNGQSRLVSKEIILRDKKSGLTQKAGNKSKARWEKAFLFSKWLRMT